MKIVKLLLLLAVILVVFGGIAAAQESLGVYGKGWSFIVSEPGGWKGVTADANKYRVNLYLPMAGYDFNSSPVLMYVRVMQKNGNTVQKSLESDMLDFSKRKSAVQFLDFPVGKLNYDYVSKKYLIDQNQADYLCYIDPGSASPYYAIFVLTGPQGECENYLNDFLSLIRSFKWLNSSK